jgi:hypothetical protein
MPTRFTAQIAAYEVNPLFLGVTLAENMPEMHDVREISIGEQRFVRSVIRACSALSGFSRDTANLRLISLAADLLILLRVNPGI